MEQTQQNRSKLELFIIAVIGGGVMYYGAILLVAFGLWCNSEYHQLRNGFRSWVITWDSGPIEITLEQNGKDGGIALVNDKEVESITEAQDYLFIQAQDLAKCRAKLGQIKEMTTLN